MMKTATLTEKTETKSEDQHLSKKAKWTNAYSVGMDMKGKMSPEFTQAIAAWEPIMETEDGPKELLEALRAREPDAVEYFMHLGNGRIQRAFKRTYKSGVSMSAEERRFAYNEFLNDIYDRTLSRKPKDEVGEDGQKKKTGRKLASPFDTFDETAVQGDILPALVGWAGRYFDTIADQIRIRSQTGGMTRVEKFKNQVSIQGIDYVDESGDDTEMEFVQNDDGSYGTNDSAVDPTAKVLADALQRDALQVWKRFCNDSKLQVSMNRVTGSAQYQDSSAYSLSDFFRDVLLGYSVTSKQYGEWATGNHPSSWFTKKKEVVGDIVKEYFNENNDLGIGPDDLYTLMSIVGPKTLASYLHCSRPLPPWQARPDAKMAS